MDGRTDRSIVVGRASCSKRGTGVLKFFFIMGTWCERIIRLYYVPLHAAVHALSCTGDVGAREAPANRVLAWALVACAAFAAGALALPWSLQICETPSPHDFIAVAGRLLPVQRSAWSPLTKAMTPYVGGWYCCCAVLLSGGRPVLQLSPLNAACCMKEGHVPARLFPAHISRAGVCCVLWRSAAGFVDVFSSCSVFGLLL